jgi:hypothetical protein
MQLEDGRETGYAFGDAQVPPWAITGLESLAPRCR